MLTAPCSKAPAGVSEEGKKPACPGESVPGVLLGSGALRGAGVECIQHQGCSEGPSSRVGFQSGGGAASSQYSALTSSFLAYPSPSGRPQWARKNPPPTPTALFHRPSLTFLARRALVPQGPLVSSESRDGRHTASSLGPCLPWSPAETCSHGNRCESREERH